MTPVPSIEHFAILIGLAFFFGLAFEELYAKSASPRPGGIRTFPLLAFVGALLYLLDPSRAIPFSVGFAVLGALLLVSYRRHMQEKDAEGRPNVTLAPALCNLLAYVLGPVALAAPPWIPVGVTITAVLLLAERERLHRFAWAIPTAEIITAGQFLILTGLVLPLLPRQPVTTLTAITPQQVWLAVVAVCTLSYASYLLQRYVVPSHATLLVAGLGGLYSSTATTIVLARASGSSLASLRQGQIGIILAVAVMYLRLLLITLFFSRSLASDLATPLVALSLLSFLMAAGVYFVKRPAQQGEAKIAARSNPLDLLAAATFAALFVVVSIASSWAAYRFGSTGVYTMAGIVGVTDINPFILTLAQHGAGEVSETVAAGAVLVATASNNLFQAIYAAVYSRGRLGVTPMIALVVLSAAGIALAFLA